MVNGRGGAVVNGRGVDSSHAWPAENHPEVTAAKVPSWCHTQLQCMLYAQALSMQAVLNTSGGAGMASPALGWTLKAGRVGCHLQGLTRPGASSSSRRCRALRCRTCACRCRHVCSHPAMSSSRFTMSRTSSTLKGMSTLRPVARACAAAVKSPHAFVASVRTAVTTCIKFAVHMPRPRRHSESSAAAAGRTASGWLEVFSSSVSSVSQAGCDVMRSPHADMRPRRARANGGDSARMCASPPGASRSCCATCTAHTRRAGHAAPCPCCGCSDTRQGTSCDLLRTTGQATLLYFWVSNATRLPPCNMACAQGHCRSLWSARRAGAGGGVGARLEAVHELVRDIGPIHQQARAQPQHAGHSTLRERDRRRGGAAHDARHLLPQQRQQHLQQPASSTPWPGMPPGVHSAQLPRESPGSAPTIGPAPTLETPGRVSERVPGCGHDYGLPASSRARGTLPRSPYRLARSSRRRPRP